MINELDKDDEITNPEVWEKANPILCSYEEGRTFLKGELNQPLMYLRKCVIISRKHE